MQEDIFINFPRFKEHSFRIVSLIPEWARAYQVPEQAILRQLSYAHAWINANPRKAPKRDPVRFLFNWMRLAQKYGNLKVPEPSKKVQPEKEPDMSFEEMVSIRKRNLGERGAPVKEGILV